MRDTLISALIDDFIKKHPDIQVAHTIDGAGSLMEHVKTQHADGNILADIIWTSEIPDFYYMKNEEMLLRYRPAGADNIFNPLPDTGDCFLPVRLGTMGIAYNLNLVETAPQSWQDLLKPEFADGFAIADPSTSGTALMSIALLNDEFGERFFHDLRANGAFIAQGSSAVVNAVAEGEYAACLAVDYMAFDKINAGAPIWLAYPPEMIVIPSPVAIFESSSNQEAAKKFIDYLITPAAQQIIAETGTLPVLKDIPIPESYSIPPVTDAMSRAIQLNHESLQKWTDDLLNNFLAIMS